MLRWFCQVKTVCVLGFALCLGACASVESEAEGEPVDVKPVQAPELSAPVYTRSDFSNASSSSLDTLLGTPSLKRREGKGEFRRYALKNCMILIILYPDEKGTSRIASLEASALQSNAARPDLDQCLAAG